MLGTGLVNDDNNNNDNIEPRTGRTWLSAGFSVTVTLPKNLAEKHGLTEPCTVVFEDNEKGILIRRLKF